MVMLEIKEVKAYVGHNNILFNSQEGARMNLANHVLWDSNLHEPYEIYLKLKEIYGQA
jgi:hypothetical protein|tara:strand:- start:109 stop:282 length:174 start_codon:yes stop_codon:yes gene_type:complete